MFHLFDFFKFFRFMFNSTLRFLVQDSSFSSSKAESYFSELIAASPIAENSFPLPSFPQLQNDPRMLPLRVAAMFKVLVCLFLVPNKRGI